MSTVSGERSGKGGVIIHRSNDRNYAALKHTLRDRKGCSLWLSFRNVTTVSLSGLYLVAIDKCLRISDI